MQLCPCSAWIQPGGCLLLIIVASPSDRRVILLLAVALARQYERSGWGPATEALYLATPAWHIPRGWSRGDVNTGEVRAAPLLQTRRCRFALGLCLGSSEEQYMAATRHHTHFRKPWGRRTVRRPGQARRRLACRPTVLPPLPGACRHKSLTGEVGRFFKDLNVAPDRGRSFYQHERQRQHLASLVDAGRCGAMAGAFSGGARRPQQLELPGSCPVVVDMWVGNTTPRQSECTVCRHAGRSRVEYAGRNITYHLFTKGEPSSGTVAAAAAVAADMHGLLPRMFVKPCGCLPFCMCSSPQTSSSLPSTRRPPPSRWLSPRCTSLPSSSSPSGGISSSGGPS